MVIELVVPYFIPISVAIRKRMIDFIYILLRLVES